jgi:O-succinylhomoserine sulfhydrylase
MRRKLHPETLAVRAGVKRSNFQEHSEAMFLTSSFVFDNAAQAAARFAEQEPGDTYSRFTNPTVTAFQDRLAALEDAEACLATSSGMSAILCTVMALAQAGDHIVASNGLFGATTQMLTNILPRFGIRTTFVETTDADAWRAAITPQTKMLFTETPTNPLLKICDLAAVADIAHRANAKLVVDNCMCTPVLQRPLEFGADLVIHSATKYIDGQGRVLGGAVLGSKEIVAGKMYPLMRTIGPTLSAFNAWVLLKGLETLRLRIEAQCATALQLARWLEAQPHVERVFHPSLDSHPQRELAARQQRHGGAIVAFEVAGGRAAAWRVVDSTQMLSITANLGDVKSTITHPASTTHGRITPEARARAGITEGLLRISVGLEHLDDLQADLARGVSAPAARKPTQSLNKPSLRGA